MAASIISGSVFIIALIVVYLVYRRKGLIGNRQIYYRDMDGTQPKQEICFPVPVTFSELDYIYKKRCGIEKWTLNVGRALDTMLKVAVNAPVPQTDKTVVIKNLKVSGFKLGFWLWSEHSVTVTFSYEVHSNGSDVGIVNSGMIEETGHGKGAEFGSDTFIPLAGNKNFNMGIELAMSRSLQQCLHTLREEIESLV